jgi:prepilin-type processing-associated H-X9-DG protein
MSDEQKKSRIKIEDLPQAEEELTPEEAKEVQGGHGGGVNVLLADGSVRFASSTDGTSKGPTDNIVGGAAGAGPHVK